MAPRQRCLVFYFPMCPPPPLRVPEAGYVERGQVNAKGSILQGNVNKKTQEGELIHTGTVHTGTEGTTEKWVSTASPNAQPILASTHKSDPFVILCAVIQGCWQIFKSKKTSTMWLSPICAELPRWDGRWKSKQEFFHFLSSSLCVTSASVHRQQTKQWLRETTWHVLFMGQKIELSSGSGTDKPLNLDGFFKQNWLSESSWTQRPWHFRSRLQRHLRSQWVTCYLCPLSVLECVWHGRSWSYR